MEEKRRESYPSDLTDKQWEEIAPLYAEMRNCTWGKRELTDAVLCIWWIQDVSGDNYLMIFRRIQQYIAFIVELGSAAVG